MGIITKSELRQNYCRTEDKLQHFTLDNYCSTFSEAYECRQSDPALSADGETNLPPKASSLKDNSVS